MQQDSEGNQTNEKVVRVTIPEYLYLVNTFQTTGKNLAFSSTLSCLISLSGNSELDGGQIPSGGISNAPEPEMIDVSTEEGVIERTSSTAVQEEEASVQTIP